MTGGNGLQMRNMNHQNEQLALFGKPGLPGWISNGIISFFLVSGLMMFLDSGQFAGKIFFLGLMLSFTFIFAGMACRVAERSDRILLLVAALVCFGMWLPLAFYMLSS